MSDSLKLRLTATEYSPPPGDDGEVVRYSEGDEFTAPSKADYDRLIEAGAAVPADAPDPNDPQSLKGDDLQAALEFYGLDDSGKADEKRERIAAHLEANPDAPRYTGT